MLYTLKRREFTNISTIGALYRDGIKLCYTLEDKDRELSSDMMLHIIKSIKVQNETAIPYGIYELRITPSARFKRLTPQLIGVPGFEGIRIHSGNTAVDTDGCVLVGTTKGHDFVSESRKAYEEVYHMMTLDCDKELCRVEIVRDVPITGEILA